jgi:hypothetical protein
MIQANSPTDRLAKVLRRFRDQDRNRPIREAWNNVLKVREDPEFFRKYALIVELCADARAEMTAAGGANPDIYVRRFGRVENVFKHGLGEALHGAIGDLDDATMEALDLAAHRCCEIAVQYNLELELLVKLKGVAEELIQVIEIADIPNGLRVTLRRHLRAIIGAIDDFDIFGADLLQTRIEAAIGSVTVACVGDVDAKDKPAVRSIMTFLKDSLTFLSVIKATGDAAKTLGDVVQHFLPK